MTTMISEIYEALTSVGIVEDKARHAAEAISAQERRFDKLESVLDVRFSQLDVRFSQLDVRFAQIETRFAKIDGELNLTKWMLGFNLATTVALLFMGLRH